MPPAPSLTPALALDYVRELSADVRAAVVLDLAGELLAGPPQLAPPARALLDAGAGAAELEAGTADGVVCAVRSGSHAAVAVCGRFAIAGIVREDMRTALAALEGRAPESAGAVVELEPGAPESAAAPTASHTPRAPESAAAPAGSHTPRVPHSTAEDRLLAASAALISAAERGFGA